MKALGREGYPASSLFVPTVAKFVTRAAEFAARCRVTATAMAVERHRLAHNGQLPDSLQELVPAQLVAVAQDPFDGKPLRFKKRSVGYAVYSIGSDGVDDAGDERDEGEIRAATYDVAFTVDR